MSFEVKKDGFVLEFKDIGIEDAMGFKDAVMKHLHQKALQKIANAKTTSEYYNLSLAMSNDKRIREETFNLIRKYASKLNGIPLNEQTAIGFIFGDKRNWEYYGDIYIKLYSESVDPFLNLPMSMLSAFTKVEVK